jgi:hypothetical protein
VQPPFNITGAPNADWVIFIGGAILCLYWLRALRLAREGARIFLRNLLMAIMVFIAVMAILAGTRLRTHLLPPQEQVIGGFVAIICFGRLQSRRRSRYIPKSVRRAVIARDLKGEGFDPEKYHIDHRWPYSKGGSHTTDNLRVIEKKENLRKGAKRPRMRDMW